MALLKYNNEILKYNNELLKYEADVPPAPLTGGYVRHYLTNEITEIPSEGAHIAPSIDPNHLGKISWVNIGSIIATASEFKIPEGIEVTGAPSFTSGNTPYLRLIDFPSTIEYIYPTAFSGMTTIDTLIVRSMIPPTVELGNPQSPQMKVYIPAAAFSNYLADPLWGNFESILYSIESM